VPKYLRLEMLPPSSTTIPGQSQGAVTQEIKIFNSMQGQKTIMLKLKIAYRQGADSVRMAIDIPRASSTSVYLLLTVFFFPLSFLTADRGNGAGVCLPTHVLNARSLGCVR
jgi:hypothetical protein